MGVIFSILAIILVASATFLVYSYRKSYIDFNLKFTRIHLIGLVTLILAVVLTFFSYIDSMKNEIHHDLNKIKATTESIHKKVYGNANTSQTVSLRWKKDKKYLVKPEKSHAWFFIDIGCFVVACICLLFALISKNEQSKKVYVAASAAATLVTAISTTKYLFKPELEFSFDPQIEIPLELNFNKPDCPCDKKPQGTEKLQVATLDIKNFPSGEAKLDTLYVQRMIKEKFIVKSKPRNYTHFYIYGGVDKKQLRRKALKNFGDNLTLAQARGNFIAAQLKIIFGNAVKYDIAINGSNAYGDRDTISFSDNRRVLIKALYKVKNPN